MVHIDHVLHCKCTFRLLYLPYPSVDIYVTVWGLTVICLWCGSENKEVYAWGSNRHGQLGIPQPLDPDNDRRNASACSTSGVEDISKPLIPSKQKDTGPFVHKNSSVEMTLTKLGFRKVDSLGSKVSWVSAGSEHSTAVLGKRSFSLHTCLIHLPTRCGADDEVSGYWWRVCRCSIFGL